MSVVAKRALMYLNALKAGDAEYAEDCAYWRSQGFTPHYCRHGKDRWTDYDNICGHCEDGYDNYTLALMSARADVAECQRRTEWLKNAPKENMPHELFVSLLYWGTEPITSEIVGY